jgi:multimeric flavodoxin WrbA
MLTMLGENLSREGLELEEIFLSQYQIGFCTGCATCLSPAPAGSGTITTR